MITKKILFINHFAGVPKINERSLRHYTLARAANSNGFDSYIITSQNHYHAVDGQKYPSNKVIEINDVNFIFIKEANFKRNNLLTKFLKMTSFSFNLFKAFIFRQINLKDIGVVYSSSPDLFTSLVSYLIARRNKARHYFEIRDIWPLSQQVLHNFSRNNVLIKILSKIEFFLYENSDLLISPLKNFDKYLLENKINTPFQLMPQTYFDYKYKIESGINLDLSSFAKVGIYTGSVGNIYQIQQLVNFFPKELKSKIAVIIIGDGDYFKELKKSINQKDLYNFFVFSTKNHQQLVQYFNISDFAFGFHPVNNELYKYGLCPLKIYDYMFNRLPILFVGEKSYLDVKSDGLIPCKFNNEKDFKLKLNKILNMTQSELNNKGLENFNVVKINNSPEAISKIFLETLK